jgi:hypothetical protein
MKLPVLELIFHHHVSNISMHRWTNLGQHMDEMWEDILRDKMFNVKLTPVSRNPNLLIIITASI